MAPNEHVLTRKREKKLMSELRWLDGYSGQTVGDLLALEGECRLDSLVLAFEEAIEQKAARDGEQALSAEARIVLAIEALEREVNDGGYQQFFLNSSKEFAPMIVDALRTIKCPKTAATARDAIDVLQLPSLTVEAIDDVMADVEATEEDLDRCDHSYYEAGEDIAANLFDLIRTNRDRIKL